MTPEREFLEKLLTLWADDPLEAERVVRALLAQPETPPAPQSAPQKPSESPTPRTDDFLCVVSGAKGGPHYGMLDVEEPWPQYKGLADFARQLERELAEELEKKREVFIALHDRALKAEADLASAIANHAADLSAQSDKKEQQIKPQPRPGAYLLESTAVNADYWLKNGRELPDRDEAVLAVEQAINAWKGVAYGLAEKLHFAGYDPTTGSCAVSAIAPLGWQPIETAPTDGTEILLTSWNKVDGYGETDFGSFGVIEKSDYDGRDVHGWLTNYDRVEEPTHWMLLL